MPESGKWHDFWLIAIGLGGLLYPLVVYVGHLSPHVLVLLALLLMSMRAVFARVDGRPVAGLWAALACGAFLVLMLLVEPVLAAKAYPVALSLSLAAAFGWSLIRPPTIVERIARLRHGDLPAPAVGYARVVTWVWTVFFVVNGAVAAALGVWGSLAQWVVWTGLLSYLAIGTIFAVEWAVRQRFLRRWFP